MTLCRTSLAGAGWAAALGMLAMGQMQDAGVEQLRRLELVDEAGQVRMVLGCEGGRPEVSLLAADGEPRVSLALTEGDRPALTLHDSGGVERLAARVADRGDGKESAGLFLGGERGERRVVLAESDRGCALAMHEDGRIWFALQKHEGESPRMYLLDDELEDLWHAP
jgi:hypothetical protein